jgi:hypothetical protein
MNSGFAQNPDVSVGALRFAILAVLGIVPELFLLEKGLLRCGKDEIGAALYALQNAVLKLRVSRPRACHILTCR